MVDGDGDGDTLADQPLTASLAACLGDALTGTIAIVDGKPVAVGAAHDSDDPDRPRTIIRLAAESAVAAEEIRADLQAAVESGESTESAQPYSEYFAEPLSEVLDEQVAIAKLVAVTANGRPAYTVRQMLAANDRPSLQAPGQFPGEQTD